MATAFGAAFCVFPYSFNGTRSFHQDKGISLGHGILASGNERPFDDARLPQEPGRFRADARHVDRGGISARRAGRGRRVRDREHVRLHRPRAARIGRHDPGAREAERARLLPGPDRHRLPDPALWRRYPQRNAGDRRHSWNVESLADRRPRPSSRRPPRLGDVGATGLSLRRHHAAAPGRPRAVRVREDRGRLRHGLHVLRDSPVPRTPSEPSPSGYREGGRGARGPRHPGSDSRLAGHPRLRARSAGRR